MALVHDYFVQDGGAERVAIELAGLLPGARVYTTFFDKRVFGTRIDPHRVRPWPLDGRVDGARFRSLLPIYPAYFSTLDLRRASLVVSSSSAFAKAVRTSRRALHVAYIHAPMRFAWQFEQYVRGSTHGALTRAAVRSLTLPLRAWDRRTSQRPDVLVANSQTVRARVRRFWGRDAQVIYPPVGVEEFPLSEADDGYLLVAARLLAHRRIDVAIGAANATGHRLIIVGDGPERRALQRAAGRTVSFEGHVPRTRLVQLVRACHAYLVPGEEDFGIAPVEAMAAGKPIVALGRGGAAETVVDGVTGVLFADHSVAGMVGALERLDGLAFAPTKLRARAEMFSRPRFDAEWRALMGRLGVDRELYGGGPGN